MTNPFENLKQQREAHEKSAKQEGQTRALAESQKQQRIEAVHQEYEEMVLGVLAQLRDAAYPGYKVNKSGYCYWAIDRRYSDDLEKVLVVSVHLHLDESQRPLYFHCYHYRKTKKKKWMIWGDHGPFDMKAGLSRAELVTVLQRLHD
jgi:hypothetical protein